MSQPFLPEIHTKRLTLRPFQKGDAQDLYEYLSDPEVVRFEPYRPYTLESCGQEAENRSKNPAFIAVVLGDKVIGNVYLAKQNDYTWEVGWVFNRAFQHHGYATEAAHAAMDWAFRQQSAHRIIAKCDPEADGAAGDAPRGRVEEKRVLFPRRKRKSAVEGYLSVRRPCGRMEISK